jgi:hypothetical protein
VLPRKWKIYKVQNYVQLIYSSLLLALVIGLYLKNNIAIDFPSLLIPVGLSVMPVNNYFNLFIIAHYFPDKAVPDQVSKLNVALIIAGVVFNVLLVVLIVIGSTEEFSHSKASSFSAGKT